VSQYWRAEAQKAYVSATVCTLVLVVAWVLALPRVPAGWPVVAVNIAGYALSVLIVIGGYDLVKKALPPFYAFLVMAATWVAIAVGVREGLLLLFG
jgi:hypothetical protein